VFVTSEKFSLEFFIAQMKQSLALPSRYGTYKCCVKTLSLYGIQALSPLDWLLLIVVTTFIKLLQLSDLSTSI
jgi:hypothetical protein